jgi:hypothetical protein
MHAAAAALPDQNHGRFSLGAVTPALNASCACRRSLRTQYKFQASKRTLPSLIKAGSTKGPLKP